MNYIILLAAAFMTIYWSSKFTQSKKWWSKVGSALMAMYGLIMTCSYVFMILITELGI